MKQHLLNVYNRSLIRIIRGKGVYLYDEKGKEYLDFMSGIATVSLGHCHPYIVKAIKKQSKELWHCSNLFTIPEQERLASRLSKLTNIDKIFFCSSGLEATETAIKLIRRYQYTHNNTKANKIITLKDGFHGRSISAISAGGNDYAREGYAPLLPGFTRVVRNDLAELESAIDDTTAGIFLELIQSEGGIYQLDINYLHAAQKISNENNLIFAIDEVQTGYGRIGSLFYHQKIGLKPDIVTCGKAIGNGFPLAACLIKEKVAEIMKPGMHGSTYGGNPLAMAVGNAVLDVQTQPQFLDEVNSTAENLRQLLSSLKKQFPNIIKETRGKGLLMGIEFNNNMQVQNLIKLCLDKGLIIGKTSHKNTIRLTPPLIITKECINHFGHVLESILKQEINYSYG